MGYKYPFDRESAISIAKDRVSKLRPEFKKTLLSRIDQALESWKQDQIQPDGTIIVEWDHIDPVFIDADGNEYGNKDQRIPASSLRPEQCGGPTVSSKSDLFTLLWQRNYGPVRKIAGEPDVKHHVAMALLVEREGHSMPEGSLEKAVSHIRESVSKELNKVEAQGDENRRKSAASRKEDKENRDERIQILATRIINADPSLEGIEVAKRVFNKIASMPSFKRYTLNSVHRRIKGVRRAILRDRKSPR